MDLCSFVGLIGALETCIVTIYLRADVEYAHLSLANALLDRVEPRAVVVAVELSVLDEPVVGDVVEHLLLRREVVLLAVHLSRQPLTRRVCTSNRAVLAPAVWGEGQGSPKSGWLPE